MAALMLRQQNRGKASLPTTHFKYVPFSIELTSPPCCAGKLMMLSTRARIICLALFLPWPGLAADSVEQLVEDYLARRATTAVASDITMTEALRTQEQFVERLAPKLGRPVGYKVGLVTKEAQEKSGVTSPIHGVLLEKMILADHAEMQIDYAVRPLLEADLVVVVRDRSINNAATPLDVLRSLKDVVAFIELPDGLVAGNQRITGSLLTAVNVGARYGVLGQRVSVKPTQAFADALEKMQITLIDGQGKEQGKEVAALILEHPLHAVLWLIEELRKEGKQLRPGDLISLGSVKAITPNPGQTYTVKYDGLPGGPISVSVRFR
jgi:2-keto-4-pentenoate hydratase